MVSFCPTCDPVERLAEQYQPFQVCSSTRIKNDQLFFWLKQTVVVTEMLTKFTTCEGHEAVRKKAQFRRPYFFFCMISGLMVHSTSSTKYSDLTLDRQSGSWDYRMCFRITILPWMWRNWPKNGRIMSPNPFFWFESLTAVSRGSRKRGPTQ